MRALIKMNTMETAIVDVVLKRNIRGGTRQEILKETSCVASTPQEESTK